MKALINVVAWITLAACATDAIIIARREASGADDGGAGEASQPDAEGDAHVESEAGPSPDAAPPEDACQTNDDCGDGRYCQLDARDALFGRCEPRPVACSANQAPVCGNDAVSYFNDCVRKQYGISFAEQGQCLGAGNVIPCGSIFSVNVCPPGTFCARLIQPTASDIPLPCEVELLAREGTCWGMPDECAPPRPGVGRWVLCPATLGGGPGAVGGPGGATFGGGTFGGGATGGGSLGGASKPTCVDTCTAIRSELVHVEVLSCGRSAGP